jgi:hypothetical protein
MRGISFFKVPDSFENRLTDFPKGIDVICEEYKLSCNSSSKYLQHIYNGLSIYLVAMVSCFSFNLNIEDIFNYRLIYVFILPILTYVFGLFYCYNGYAIASHGLFQMYCELKIRILIAYHMPDIQVDPFYGWNLYKLSNTDEKIKFPVLKSTNILVLPYGTCLVLFLLTPAITILVGCRRGWHLDWTNSNVISYVLISMVFYAIYLGFMLVLIQKNYIILSKKMNNVSVYCKVNNLHMKSKFHEQ